MKFKKLLCSISLLLMIDVVSAQCSCDCKEQAIPAMFIMNSGTEATRDESFSKTKKDLLMSDFSREIPIDLNSFKKLLGDVVSSGASGIRVYFAQVDNGKLTLLFVPTVLIPGNIDDQHDDRSDKFYQLRNRLNTAIFESITEEDAKNLRDNYTNDFKGRSEQDAPLHSHNRKETISLFYLGDHIKQLYDAISGCLKNQVQGVSVRFVAYGEKETIDRILKDGTKVTKAVGNQLLIHFVFYDCYGQEVDFIKCYNPTKMTNGVADTGLPCPDFCVGGATGLLKK